MWKLILKSDLEVVFRPEDPALGSWNPATEMVTLNLSAIAKVASLGGTNRQMSDINLTPETMPKDSRLINLLISVINHEYLHEALHEGIKQQTKDIAHAYLQEGIDRGIIPEGVLTEARFRGRNEQFVKVFYDAYYLILQEYAVRWVEGKHSSIILTELVGYVANLYEKFERQIFKILEGFVIGDLDEDEVREFTGFVELMTDQVTTTMQRGVADTLNEVQGRMSWVVNKLNLGMEGPGLTGDEEEELP